ncbi:MAG: phosphonate ABC transporter substrate-binding protein [Arcobacter sp.]|nr:phosphonate ABC transporter substrate-binding protein [Arcobacter sp.]|tara:strand:- start:2055 stop:2870 length:816 start_codon:yes stop_codon:yes gene_type:complete
MKNIFIITLLLLTNFLFANELKFGVYTSDKPSIMYKKFKPVLDYLEKDLEKKGINTKIKLKIYPSYEKAIDGLINSEYDFARFGPASYILSKNKNENIKLLVMEISKNKKTFNGVFITKSDSDITNLKDLKNKSFAFGNDKSTIGRYLAQEQLLKNGITSKELSSFKYLGRHDKVALAVANGNFDAGVVKEKTFKKYKSRGIKSIHKFKNITKPWIVRQNMPIEIYNALKESMLNLKDKKVLKIFKGDGFVETSDKEYNFVRDGINLSKSF